MKYIVISGIDGSGKTTIIKELQAALHQRGAKTQYVWMRYNHYLVKVLNAAARVFGWSEKTNYGEKLVWEHHYFKTPRLYHFYMFSSYLDNFISASKVKKINRRHYDYVICDRWINDIIADIGSEFRREDIVRSNWYSRFQNILPKNTVQFIITRPDECLLDAREANKYDVNFNVRLELYKRLVREGKAIEVDNSGSVSQSVNYILNKI